MTVAPHCIQKFVFTIEDSVSLSRTYKVPAGPFISHPKALSTSYERLVELLM